MNDIKLLLREAVPVDGAEPDLDVVADRVQRRRRRRRRTQRLAVVAVVVGVIGGVTVAEQGLLGPDHDAATVTGDGSDASNDGERDAPPGDVETPDAETPDASAFARLLASREWLAQAQLREWPVQPDEFMAGPPEEGFIVFGTLVDVRPGAVTTSFCVGVPRCGAQANVETVIRVDLIAPGDQAHPDEMVFPWVTGQFETVEHAAAETDLLAAPFEAAAPIGSRVIMFLRPGGGEGDAYEWRPEPSGIVIEHGDRVALPQPDPTAPDLSWTFDDFAAEINRLGSPLERLRRSTHSEPHDLPTDSAPADRGA